LLGNWHLKVLQIQVETAPPKPPQPPKNQASHAPGPGLTRRSSVNHSSPTEGDDRDVGGRDALMAERLAQRHVGIAFDGGNNRGLHSPPEPKFPVSDATVRQSEVPAQLHAGAVAPNAIPC
jgi:hypothetical protein